MSGTSPRLAAAGAYIISLEDGRMHLSYALGLPARPAEVQRDFAIAPEASYVLSVKNPKAGQYRGARLARSERAKFPETLQREFRGRRFAAEDVRLLDVEGAEFILVGARGDPERSYGLDLDTPHGDRHHRTGAAGPAVAAPDEAPVRGTLGLNQRQARESS